MKFTSLINRAFRGLRTARVRTLLTALAIAVGGFVLTLTLAASTGAREFADNLISDSIDPKTLIVSKIDLTSESSFTTPQEYDEESSVDASGFQYLDGADLKKLESYDFTESVREMYTVTPRFIGLERDGKQASYNATISSNDPALKLALVAGTGAQKIPDGAIVLSDSYREAAGFASAEDFVGTKVDVVVDSPARLLNPEAPPLRKTFTVSGVLNNSTLSGEPLGIYINPSEAKTLADFATKGTPAYQKYVIANMNVKNGDDSETMQQAQRLLEKDGFNSIGAADAQEMVGQIIDVLQGIVLGFGTITLVASVFGVVNTMYISVLERTREIGLMKALGMSQRALKWLFRIEAAWIGLLGGMIGSLLGWGVGSALNPWISDQLDLDNHLLVFPFGQIVAMIVVLMAVAMLAGMLPARKAAKLDPVEALRTE